MINAFEFKLDRPGLQDALFLVTRDALPTNGDLEFGFLEAVTDLRKLQTLRFVDAFAQSVSSAGDDRVLVVIRNADLVLDDGLPTRIANAIGVLPADEKWSLAGAGGLGLEERRHLMLYASNSPAIPVPDGPHPIIDIMPDLYLVNVRHAVKTLRDHGRLPEAAPELCLLLTGYLAGRYAVYLDQLSAGINGDLLARDLSRLTETLNSWFGSHLAGQKIETLSGPVLLEDPDRGSSGSGQSLQSSIWSLVAAASEPPSLSILTRTRFDRPHLLRRLLTTISRSRSDRFNMEVVISTDISADRAEAEFCELVSDFPNLILRLSRNEPRGFSRVNNLVHGVQACENDYIVCIDDDDYVDLFAFDNILPAFFRGQRPLVIMSSAVHKETWEHPGPACAVVSESCKIKEYPARNWRKIFSGVNQLPICAVLMPRDFLTSCLEDISLDYDLSEDYALFLRLFVSSNLPSIYESDQIFAHISLRSDENSVTVADRRPWVRDISGHLSHLTGNPKLGAPGQWTMLRTPAHSHLTPATQTSLKDLRTALTAAETDIRVLSHENTHLRNLLVDMQEQTA